MSSFADNLIHSLEKTNDTSDVCRVLLDASMGENYLLSDEQFKILLSIFTESQIAASIIVFLHNFDEFNEDVDKIQMVYGLIHKKFVEENSTFKPSIKNIIA